MRAPTAICNKHAPNYRTLGHGLRLARKCVLWYLRITLAEKTLIQLPVNKLRNSTGCMLRVELVLVVSRYHHTDSAIAIAGR